ncbi:uncharacterized protein LOC117921749 [Vitis riparia]|uniref:uncharacterized protein LOC117921749 n=1 Tax=Vitis riparia TaxID=96939 RepID=UPI00155A4BFE|nr:uncharacterized protein LOC117921749 [Vitis riparia]
MVEDLLKARHLKQYVRTVPKGGESPHSRGPRAPAAPIRAMINYIYRGSLDDEYSSKRKRQRLLRAATVREHVSSIRQGLANGSIHPIDGTIVFLALDPTRVLQPHQDALILTIGVAVIKRMGFEPSSMENPGRTLSGFNGSSTTSVGDVILPVHARPVILNILFSVVEDLSPFNAILGRTWLHGMKAIPSTYHQKVNFITQVGKLIFVEASLLLDNVIKSLARLDPAPTASIPPKKQMLLTNSSYSTRETKIPR